MLGWEKIVRRILPTDLDNGKENSENNNFNLTHETCEYKWKRVKINCI